MDLTELKTLDNKTILTKTETLVREERRITTEVLQCLYEVERRILYAELGYSSLYDFCTKHLQYSEGSAHRRISAMRLLRDLPANIQTQTEEKIKAGAVSITNLSLVHGFLKAEKREEGRVYSVPEKLELLNQIENQSKREIEKKLAAIQPKILPQSSERVLTEKLTEIKFVADDQLMKKLKRVKEVAAHQTMMNHSSSSFHELVHLLADEYLKHRDPLLKAGRSTKADDPKMKSESDRLTAVHSTSPATKPRVSADDESALLSIRSRYIPAQVRDEIWKRDQGMCAYSSCGKKCESKYGLEIDHIIPFAMGGTHELSNLRLLCRNHNQYQAKKMWG